MLVGVLVSSCAKASSGGPVVADAATSTKTSACAIPLAVIQASKLSYIGGCDASVEEPGRLRAGVGTTFTLESQIGDIVDLRDAVASPAGVLTRVSSGPTKVVFRADKVGVAELRVQRSLCHTTASKTLCEVLEVTVSAQ
jgi:hypothetical protein